MFFIKSLEDRFGLWYNLHMEQDGLYDENDQEKKMFVSLKKQRRLTGRNILRKCSPLSGGLYEL